MFYSPYIGCKLWYSWTNYSIHGCKQNLCNFYDYWAKWRNISISQGRGASSHLDQWVAVNQKQVSLKFFLWVDHCCSVWLSSVHFQGRMNQDQFLLKWNNHQNNFVEVFSYLRTQVSLDYVLHFPHKLTSCLMQVKFPAEHYRHSHPLLTTLINFKLIKMHYFKKQVYN